MSIYIDLILIFLLIASNIYIFILVRNLKSVQKGKAELKKVIDELNFTILKAEKAVQGLQQNAKSKGVTIQKQIDEGERLLQELQYIHQAGDNVAQRLEVLVQAKSNEKLSEAPVSTDADQTNVIKSEQEQELSRALNRKKLRGRR